MAHVHSTKRCSRCNRLVKQMILVGELKKVTYLCPRCVLDPNRISMPGMKPIKVEK